MHTSAQGEGGDVADIALNWLERYGAEFTKALPSHIDNGAFFAAVRAGPAGPGPLHAGCPCSRRS